jgi:hypothetical protein
MVITVTIREAVMLVLLIEGTYGYAVVIASSSMINVRQVS